MMNSYHEVDGVIDAWVQAKGLVLFTEWAGQPARFFHVPGEPPFECFQIAVDPPSDGKARVWTRSIDTNDGDELEASREGPLDKLEALLDFALLTVQVWRDRLGRRTTREAMQNSAEPTVTAAQVASDWIAYARYDEPNAAPDDLFARGWVLNDLVSEDPERAWQAIRAVIESYSEAEIFSEAKTEAQSVIGHLAAGPLEDLLSFYGPQFIDSIESEARRDRRVAWALGGVWQSSMTDRIWARVQAAAGDHPYWK